MNEDLNHSMLKNAKYKHTTTGLQFSAA